MSEEKAWTEPEITINGVKLTTGQAMTLRVALGTLCISLNHDGLGTDDNGRALTDAYLRNAAQIHRLMEVK